MAVGPLMWPCNCSRSVFRHTAGPGGSASSLGNALPLSCPPEVIQAHLDPPFTGQGAKRAELQLRPEHGEVELQVAIVCALVCISSRSSLLPQRRGGGFSHDSIFPLNLFSDEFLSVSRKMRTLSLKLQGILLESVAGQ